MRQKIFLLAAIISATITLSAQNEKNIEIVELKKTYKTVSFILHNDSNTGIAIEYFNAKHKGGKYHVNSYILNNDTLAIYWNNEDSIHFANTFSGSYKIDGERVNHAHTLAPKQKIKIKINLMRTNEDKNIAVLQLGLTNKKTLIQSLETK